MKSGIFQFAFYFTIVQVVDAVLLHFGFQRQKRHSDFAARNARL
jgi:hypothetical protein